MSDKKIVAIGKNRSEIEVNMSHDDIDILISNEYETRFITLDRETAKEFFGKVLGAI